MNRITALLVLCFAVVAATRLDAQSTPSNQPALPMDFRKQAEVTMKRAAVHYRSQVARRGGYAYYYSVDLKDRWGEGKVSADTVLVQPPGTPTVGMAYLNAYAATGDRFYLDSAREAAEALAYGQLPSGGWTQVIDFAPANPSVKYRQRRGGPKHSSLDDGQTQAALQMLIRADEALDFKHSEIHEATTYGLKALLAAQFPSGAFPQVWTGPVESRPVIKASFPTYDWRTEGRIKNYWDYYTLNDNVAGTVADTLILAHEVFKEEKYEAALKRLGDFLIIAQMPEPQPGWCQQYNEEMQPIWARKFEPPAITGWESQDVMETLIKISRYTGEANYLEPIPRALDYFKRSLLPDGKVARYYELKTNRPLYMDSKYQLTYDESVAPRHYGWKQSARFSEIEKAYRAAKDGVQAQTTGADDARPATELERAAMRVIEDLDEEGRWISTDAGEPLVGQPKFSPSFRYLSSDVFSRNLELLARYIMSDDE